MKGYEKKPYAEVMAVDGMFMASQTDIAWREDLFDGWDFYDLSQCCEMLRKGKKIVVPTQEKTWIYHDNKRSALKKFDFYRERFIEEYQDIYPFSKEDGNPFTKQQEYENINDQACRHLAHLIDCGQIDEVCKLFSQPQYKGFLILREIELICAIYSAEKQLYGESVLYGSGDSYSDAYDKLCGLRHSLIKLAVNYEHTKDLPLQIKTCYTPVATALAINAYCYNKSHVCAKLGSLYDAKERFTFQRVTNTLTAAAQNPPVKDSAADTLIIIREYDGKTLKNLINGKDYCADVNCETETVTPAKNRELYQNLFVNPNIVSLVNSLQPYIYTEYDRIIIWGDGMEEYVKLFHNTEIDVTWYIHTPASHTHRFSGNIKILCMTE